MGDEKPRLLYRCNGKKCKNGIPLCFFTADPQYALPAFQPLNVSDDPTEEMINEWTKQSQELAEWQTFLPVEKRMDCKKDLPVIDLGGEPDGSVQA